MFRFVGTVPASKSIFNRVLIIKSWNEEINIGGNHQSDDVANMLNGLESLRSGNFIDCGDGGTTLRFLALRASRIPGEHTLVGSQRLFERPHQELKSIFGQLNVKVEFESQKIIIKSEGWKPQGDMLLIPSKNSSQFASAVLLNCWNLPFPMFLSPSLSMVSEPYWNLTKILVKNFGMALDEWDHEVRIPQEQFPEAKEFQVEPDMSSTFSIAAVAAIQGTAVFQNMPLKSVQPDFSFIKILKLLGVSVEQDGKILKVSKSENLKELKIDLKGTPDLFPVLASLCAFAPGESQLTGAAHLAHKESDRISKVAELISKLGRQVDVHKDGITILPGKLVEGGGFKFSTDFDHRLAMAASLFMKVGYDIQLDDPHVVSKSFRDYWKAIGVPL